MTDIVEQLRTESSVQLAFGQDLSVLLDAALEIERLRTDLDDWAFNYSKDMKKLKKEIERLRAERAELRKLLVDLGAGIPAAAILKAEDRHE